MKNNRIGNRSGMVSTYVIIDGFEQDVSVEYRICPAEPDVNFDGDIEIEAVWFEDQGNIIDDMSDSEFDQLKIRVTDEINGYGDPRDERADYLHDLAKDK